MKDEIQNITNVMKEIARIRGVYETRFPSSSTASQLRDIEQDLADIREIMDF